MSPCVLSHLLILVVGAVPSRCLFILYFFLFLEDAILLSSALGKEKSARLCIRVVSRALDTTFALLNVVGFFGKLDSRDCFGLEGESGTHGCLCVTDATGRLYESLYFSTSQLLIDLQIHFFIYADIDSAAGGRGWHRHTHIHTHPSPYTYIYFASSGWLNKLTGGDCKTAPLEPSAAVSFRRQIRDGWLYENEVDMRASGYPRALQQ